MCCAFAVVFVFVFVSVFVCCVCMCVCLGVCSLHVGGCTRLCMLACIHACKRVHASVCLHVRVHECLRAFLCVLHVCVCVCVGCHGTMFACMRVCVRVCMNVCVCVCVTSILRSAAFHLGIHASTAITEAAPPPPAQSAQPTLQMWVGHVQCWWRRTRRLSQQQRKGSMLQTINNLQHGNMIWQTPKFRQDRMTVIMPRLLPVSAGAWVNRVFVWPRRAGIAAGVAASCRGSFTLT